MLQTITAASNDGIADGNKTYAVRARRPFHCVPEYLASGDLSVVHLPLMITGAD